MLIPSRFSATVTAVAVLAAGLATATVTAAPVAAADDVVTWTDGFDGTELDGRWTLVNPDPSAVSVSDGALRIAGQPGDTYQTINTAKNIAMLDVPEGDFTATADVSAGVAKVYQGAGLIAWQDMDNYVRSGLTFVGNLSPSGIAVETDVESGASFSAVSFADRPASAAERIRLQRVGNTITSSYWTGADWVIAGTTPVSFDTTQVGLYALAAQDGTVLPAAFDNFTLEHTPGANVAPQGTFVLQSAGDAPYVVVDRSALTLTADQPTASLRLHATDLGDGALAIRTDDGPLVLEGGALVLGAAAAEPTPLRITDAGGGRVVLRDAASPASYVTRGADGALVMGAEADAVRFLLSEVDDSLATLAIDGDGTGASISDTMFGIFYEDINYAADGGLYAELVRNRSFEFNSTDNGSFTGLTAWQVLNRSGAGTTATVVNDAGRLNDLNRNHLSLVAAAAGDGVRNVGFNNGIVAATGKLYDASVWARTTTAQSLTVRVEDNAGTGVLATGTVAVDGTDAWKKYDVTLTATGTTDAGRLAVLAGAPSTVALDMVSLLPRDTWVGPVNGSSVLRKDLAEKIAAMNPSFVRFPGGCVTNVGTFRTYEECGYTDRQRTYQWKETIGPVEERADERELLGLQPVLRHRLPRVLRARRGPRRGAAAGGVGRGQRLRQQHPRDARPGDDRPVGAGHPRPDRVRQRRHRHRVGRQARRAGPPGAVRPRHDRPRQRGEHHRPSSRTSRSSATRSRRSTPTSTIISNSGPDDTGARFDTLWDFNRAQDVDLVDEHYYNDPSWFLENHHRYDSYDREGPKVFLGEYASRGNTLCNALSEAAYMTGLERNADVVQLASYAPLLANESHVQWTPDAIWFDNDESWETPNWEVQKLFGNNVGDQVVPEHARPVGRCCREHLGRRLPVHVGHLGRVRQRHGDLQRRRRTLFADDFADGSQWTPQSGSWAAVGRSVRAVVHPVNDARSIVTGAYDKDWSNYTLELDATKLAGAEGFLVGFGATGANNYYWWNLGGWNNTRSVLQKAAGGGAPAR